MRIDQLDLLAFGPFTSQSLELDGGNHGLHVVYGTNEAGKSSALRALRQLLFGIPHNSDDNFLHAHPDLRIGAKLKAAGGDILDCIRRKGKTNTLRGPDDVAIVEPNRLSALLGGLDENAFSLQFGIDCDALKRGGDAIVDGHGDVGVALFAAGSGIVDLRRILEQLTQEAEGLFLPRGKVQRINKALSELDAAKKRVKDAQLPTAEWSAQDLQLRSAQSRKAAIDHELLAKGTERSRLERIEKALPQIARRSQALVDLAAVAHAPLLPPDFSERRRLTVSQLQGAEAEAHDLAEHLVKLQARIAELNPPQALLAHRDPIERLHQELGAYRKAQLDRPHRVREQQAQLDAARMILRELGQASDLETVERLRISRAERQHIQNLGQDQKDLESKCQAARELTERLQAGIELCEQELAKQGSVPDPEPLKLALQSAGAHGDLDDRLAQTRAALVQIQQQAEIDLDRHLLWRGSLEELEKLAVPAQETVERFDDELDGATTEIKALDERIAEADQRLRQAEQQLERLRLMQDVPTEEDLAAARARRDEGWRLVRRAWEEGHNSSADVAAFVEQFGSRGDLAAAYENSVAQADGIADRLRREAEHVAHKAQLIADRQGLLERRADLVTNRGHFQKRRDEIQQQWREQWTPLAIDPQSPREMRAWLRQHANLASAAAEVRRQQAAAAELEETASTCRLNLERALAKCGPALPDSGESCNAVMRRGAALVAALELRRTAQHSAQLDLNRLRKELQEAQRQLSRANEEREGWLRQWRDVTRRLNLAEDAGAAAVNQVVVSLDELFGKLQQADVLHMRIEGIDRDAKEFGERLREVADSIAIDTGNQPIDLAVADLHGRLAQAQKIQVQLDELRQQQQREQRKFDKLKSDIGQLKVALDAMCSDAQVEQFSQLPDAEDRSARRRRCEAQITEAEERILELSAGGELPAFLAEAAAVAADELPTTIRRLAEEIRQLDGERGELLQSIGRQRNELEKMDGSSRAAQAQEEASTLAAQIQADAEHYRRLRLAAGVLRSAIERYRERHQGPVVQLASALFSQLTLGSFEGLRADYNDSGQMVLVGFRSSGRQTVAVECMSDGARDQLYLALRLASLHTYLDSKEPIPFIVDDILIKFDDERATAALEALAQLSKRTQVIFFTHHEHLVELARQNLNGDTLFTHQLDCRRVAGLVAAG